MAKSWYTSKTLWANNMAVVAIIVQTQTGLVMDAEIQVAILAVINFILRLVTRQQIDWKDPPSTPFLCICLCICTLSMFSSCAGNRVLTDIGANVGKADVETYEKAKIGAADIKRSWPFVGGLIKGTMGQSYDYDLSTNARKAAERLDQLADKHEALTPAEEGEIIGARDRFGWYWAKYIKDRYGMPLWEQIKTLTGIAVPF